MLGNATKKKLRNQQLLSMLKKESNPTQAKHRIRVKSNVAIKDLILLSKRTPSYLIEEFLPMSDVLALVTTLLEFGTGKEGNSAFDSRTSELAAALAEKALMSSVWQLGLLFKETPALGEPVLIHLRNAISICRELAYKIELIEQDKIASDENSRFLFKWSNISQKGAGRLSDYIAEQTSIPIDNIMILEADDKSIAMLLSSIGDEEPTIDGVIKMRHKDKAILSISSGKNKWQNILDVKESYGNRYVFGRKLIRNQLKNK